MNADLEMQDFVFGPPCLEVSTTQGLHLHNEGTVTHNWSVEGFGLDVDVCAVRRERRGRDQHEPTGLEPGTYTFFCKFHRESKGMEGNSSSRACSRVEAIAAVPGSD